MKPIASVPLPVNLYRPSRIMRWCLVLLMVWTTVSYGASAGSALKNRTAEANQELGTGKASSTRTAPDKGSAPPSQSTNVNVMVSLGSYTNPSEFITINFKNGDLANVLRMIGRASGINLIFGKEITGQVTMELRNVHWTDALNSVLRSQNCSMVKDTDKIIRIVRAGEGETEPVAYEVIALDYANAAEMKSQVQQLLTKDIGSVDVNIGANALVVCDIPTKLSQVRDLVKQRLDIPTRQVLIEARFLEIGDSGTSREGVDWSAMGDYSVAVQSMLMEFDRNVTWARDGNNPNSKYQAIHELPIPSGLPASKMKSYSINQIQNTSYDLAAEDFTLVFSLLMNDGRAKLISNPKLQTMDNRQASIRVAETRYKPTFTFNRETGSYEISDLEELYIGITLDVTPSINPKGEIKLKIKPVVSALAGEQIIQGVAIPVLNERVIETEVTLQDTHTVAIGGMIRDDWAYSDRSVPYFGDIPYVGKACFTWQSKEKRTINLVIFITPTIVKEKEQNTKKLWRKQLEAMHVTENGEFVDKINNYPSSQLIEMQERLLINDIASGTEPGK